MTGSPSQAKKKLANIWITSKARMYSERRYKRYHLVSHLLLSYFSLIIIAIAVFSKLLEKNIEFFPQINIMIATILFATSLVVYGFRFGEMSRSHRNCYLQLQELLSSSLTENQILTRFNQILWEYPNHAERDYERLIIDRTFLKKKQMWDSEGPVKHTPQMLIAWFGRILFFWGFIIMLVSLPAYFLIIPLSGTGS